MATEDLVKAFEEIKKKRQLLENNKIQQQTLLTSAETEYKEVLTGLAQTYRVKNYAEVEALIATKEADFAEKVNELQKMFSDAITKPVTEVVVDGV